MRWSPGAGVVTFPSGRTARGRALRGEATDPAPTVGLYLSGRPVDVPGSWEQHWLRWPDFRSPTDPLAAVALIGHLWTQTGEERVEVACAGGRGRTGTVLSCWAVLDGLTPPEAIAYVREHYHRRAVETPGQRRFVARIAQLRSTR